MLIVPSPAHAGTYKMYTCNVPGRATPVPSTAPWTMRPDGLHTFPFDECAGGQNFGIALNIRVMNASTEASWVLERPTEGPRSAIGIVRYRTWISAELAGTGGPAFIDIGGACAPPGCVTPDAEPWISVPFSQTNRSVSIRLRCTAADCAFNSARPLQVRGVEVDLYEDVAPEAQIEGGTLLAGGTANGQRTLSFSATDQESGIARVEALLGDAVVATHELESSSKLCPHTDLTACATRYASDFVVDTSRVDPGQYSMALRVTDAAGNRRVITHAAPVTVGRSGGAEGAARLNASFGRSGSTYTTNFGRAVRVRGQLTGPSGEPIARALLAITEKASTGRVNHGSVTTGADGRFAFRASGRRPSRSLQFEYARPGVRALSRRLRLNVRAASTLKVSLRGINVRYSGRVLSRPIRNGGTKVFIQGRAAGGAWQRFAVRRTDKRGRFSGRYRLRVRRPGVRLQFRVEIPKQAGYPFASRTGAPITRVVR